MVEQSQPIGKLLEGLLARAHKQQSVLFEVQQAWVKIVGKRFAAHTRPASFRKGRLVIHVDRPGENFELNYGKQKLLKRIKEITQDKVEEVVIRAGKV